MRELQFMCDRLDFRHTCICSLKKFLFLHKVSRLDNSVLKMCYLFYCQSTEFVCMCHEFDIALDICTVRDIRHKISAHFNCVAGCHVLLFYVLYILHCIFLYFCLMWRTNLIIINSSFFQNTSATDNKKPELMLMRRATASV